MSERLKDKKQKNKKTEMKIQRPEREFYIVMSGQFRTLAMFSFLSDIVCLLPLKPFPLVQCA